MTWPTITFRDFCKLFDSKWRLSDFPKCPATQKYKAKEYEITRALSGFVKATQGRDLGPHWARK